MSSHPKHWDPEFDKLHGKTAFSVPISYTAWATLHVWGHVTRQGIMHFIEVLTLALDTWPDDPNWPDEAKKVRDDGLESPTIVEAPLKPEGEKSE